MSDTDQSPVKIDSKIVTVSIALKPSNAEKESEEQATKPAEPLKPYARPHTLRGMTYKIKPPSMEAALYITINDLELPDGRFRPMEIFLNTKDVEHTQWRMAVSRLLSALLRQPLPFEFAVEELKQVFDPEGPYFLQKNDPAGKGKCPGVVAHIARIIEVHCRSLGLMPVSEAALPAQALSDKLAEAKKNNASIQVCRKCNEQAAVMMDGCWTCTSCGDSKCG